MRHPHSRAERRGNRVVIMARRREIIRRSYSPNDICDGRRPEENSAWNSCNKWNLCCTCRHCRNWRGMLKEWLARQRIRRAVEDNIQTWGEA